MRKIGLLAVMLELSENQGFFSFFSEIDLDLQKSDVEKPFKKYLEELQYFLFSKCPRKLKSDYGARRTECPNAITLMGGVPSQNLHGSMENLS